MKRHLATLLCCAALVVGTSAQAARLIVAEARSVGYAPGASIESDHPLNLSAGQHLTLITPSGGTINLDGPFHGTPESTGGGSTLGTALAALTGGGHRYGEVGTTRGTVLNKLPSPWVLDVSHSGKSCIMDGHQLVLWRPAVAKDGTVEIVPADQSWKAQLNWPAGSDRLAIATAIPLHDGVSYVVTTPGGKVAIAVDRIPSALDSANVVAAFMAARGCEEQAVAMAATGSLASR